MNYLIVRKTKSPAISEMQVVPETASVNHDNCEVWAISSGKQVLDVYGQLASKMKKFHMHGNFDRGAMYVLEYDDLVRVCCTILGPSDKMRCELLEYQAKADAMVEKEKRSADLEQFIEDMCGGILKVVWVIICGCFKVVWYSILMLLFLKWMRKKKR